MDMKNKYWHITAIIGFIATIVTVINVHTFDGSWSSFCMVLFSILVPISSIILRKKAVPSFLFATFFALIVIRNADQHDWSAVGWTTAIVLIPLLLQLVALLKQNYKENGSTDTALSFLRMFIGLNWITHCTEKLFLSNHDAGLLGFFQNVAGANLFGHPLTESGAHYLIAFAGLGELAAAVFLGLGLFTRFGAFVAAVYLVFAEVLSGHFGVGYTWMLPGGGWEVCFYYFMVTIPFLLPRTAGTISLDAFLNTDVNKRPIIRAVSGA